jgi:RNA polymerase sigma-70 factor (ECF subfamily)
VNETDDTTAGPAGGLVPGRSVPPSWPPLPQDLTELQVCLPVEFQAFQELYTQPYLMFAHLHLGSRCEAEALVDTVFFQLARHWTHVLQQERPESYAWAVLKQLVGERRLQLGLDPTTMVATASFTSAMLKASRDQLATMESNLGLYTAIANLPERQGDVVMLRFVLGYADERTAAIMGINEGTVRSNIRFARRRLARELGIDWTDQAGE